MNVSTRTVRRWFERGVIAGRRTSGGQWQLARNPLANISRMPLGEQFRWERLCWVLVAITNGRVIDGAEVAENVRHGGQSRSLTAKMKSHSAFVKSDGYKRAFDLALALRALRPEDLENSNSLDAERFALIWEAPASEFIPDQAWRAFADPASVLKIASIRVVQDGGTPSTSRIAATLGISRSSLYRRYTVEQIRDAVEIGCAYGGAAVPGR